VSRKPYLSFCAFLLSIVVVYAHTSIALHDADHPFHTHTKTCEAYTLAQHNSDSSLISQAFTILLSVHSPAILIPFSQVIRTASYSFIAIRAPPFTHFS